MGQPGAWKVGGVDSRAVVDWVIHKVYSEPLLVFARSAVKFAAWKAKKMIRKLSIKLIEEANTMVQILRLGKNLERLIPQLLV